jgi:hypothetical protein
VEGHTDAKPIDESLTYTNWELSADWANSARRVMQQNGLKPDQIVQVRGSSPTISGTGIWGVMETGSSRRRIKLAHLGGIVIEPYRSVSRRVPLNELNLGAGPKAHERRP